MATGGLEQSFLSSDEAPIIKCCICKGRGLFRDAEKYCVECKSYLCLSCKDTHAQFPILMVHQLLDKSDFGSHVSCKYLPCIPTERCFQHPRNILDLYCQDHDEVGCSSCVALRHRLCAKIFSIPEDIDRLYCKEQLKEIKQKLDISKTRMEEMRKITETRIKDLKKSLDEAVESVKSFRRDIDKLLESMEQKTIQILQAIFEKTEQMFKEKLHEVENMFHSVSEVAAKLRNSAGNDAQEFVSSKLSTKTISEADWIERQHQQVDARIVFTRDDKVVSCLQPLTSLGEVSTVSTERKWMEQKATLYKVKKETLAAVSTENKRTEQKTSLYTVQKQTEISVKLPKDGADCCIYGSCITEDGWLLLTDQNNMKLKRVDMPTETVKDWLDLLDYPYAVCSVGRAEAAVTLDNESVQFVSLGDKLIPARTLQMNHKCCGIACTQGKLFISDCGNNVYMYNTRGQHLKRVSPTNVFSATRHIAVSGVGVRVYVADCYKGLAILDSAGNHLSTVTDPTVSSYFGVCTDGRNIFVSGYSSNNIVQIGKHHKLLGEVAKVTRPLSLSFDRQRNMIIVSKENDNKITILTLM